MSLLSLLIFFLIFSSFLLFFCKVNFCHNFGYIFVFPQKVDYCLCFFNGFTLHMVDTCIDIPSAILLSTDKMSTLLPLFSTVCGIQWSTFRFFVIVFLFFKTFSKKMSTIASDFSMVSRCAWSTFGDYSIISCKLPP